MQQTWREIARATIEQVAAECAAEGLDRAATLARIDAAYPFGPREHYPYAMWLSERRKWRQATPKPRQAELSALAAWNAGQPIRAEETR